MDFFVTANENAPQQSQPSNFVLSENRSNQLANTINEGNSVTDQLFGAVENYFGGESYEKC